MRHSYILITVILALCFCSSEKAQAQSLAVKSNLLYDITGTLNLGGEIKCSDAQSFCLNLSYNPWESGENKKMKLFLIQPEYRKWLNETFIGSFVGIQAHYGLYNFGKSTPFTTVKNNRYQGTAVGVGITYGHQWILSSYWSLEASLSMGYMHLNYKKYEPQEGGALLDKSRSNYWGPTQASVSIVYFIQ